MPCFTKLSNQEWKLITALAQATAGIREGAGLHAGSGANRRQSESQRQNCEQARDHFKCFSLDFLAGQSP
jgi:hypothetical protein